jgi:hypothetical protein
VQASDAALLKKGITELADCLGRGEGAADWHKAMSIIDDMARNGVRPDISCYNVALAACVRADKLDQVSTPSHESSWHIRTLRMTVPSRISDTHTCDDYAASWGFCRRWTCWRRWEAGGCNPIASATTSSSLDAAGSCPVLVMYGLYKLICLLAWL